MPRICWWRSESSFLSDTGDEKDEVIVPDATREAIFCKARAIASSDIANCICCVFMSTFPVFGL